MENAALYIKRLAEMYGQTHTKKGRKPPDFGPDPYFEHPHRPKPLSADASTRKPTRDPNRIAGFMRMFQ